jgi:hypothetical protein
MSKTVREDLLGFSLSAILLAVLAAVNVLMGKGFI